MKNKIKIFLSISALNLGGAENQFLELVRGIDKGNFDVHVVLMYDGTQDNMLSLIENIKILKIYKKNRYDILSYIRYVKVIRYFKPQLIYSFLPDMNLISYICKLLSFSKTKLVWGIRSDFNYLVSDSIFSKLVFKLQKLFSSKIDLIIFNSYNAKKSFLNHGFRFNHLCVIPNGINYKKYCPNSSLRIQFRTKYSLDDSDIAIGIVSRYEYVKGMDIFCSAASLLLNKYNNVYFFSVGYGDEKIVEECKLYVQDYIDSRFFFLGKLSSPEFVYNGLDIYCSTSRVEGFSNSIAEALLYNLPLIVSDVGDSANIVSDFGLTFTSEDVDDLCSKLDILIVNQCERLKKMHGREKMIDLYSTSRMVEITETELLNII